MRPRVIILGAGDVYATEGQLQAACLIQASRGSYLLDCGATILASLKKQGLSAEPIEAVVLSHFHGDHFAGLPFLFLEYIHTVPRSRPLRIVGPPGVEERVMALFGAMYADTASEPLPYALEFIEVRPNEPLAIDGLKLKPFQTPHQDWPLSLGYTIDVDGRKILYSGDTGWTEDLVTYSQGVDLFICECSFFETRMDTHIDYPRIAENLGRFGAKRMALTHLGEETLLRRDEIGVEMAFDGMAIDL